MDQIWYYSLDGEQQGPVSAEELLGLKHSGTISDSTQLWREGLTDWQPLASLQHELQGAPPSGSAEPGDTSVYATPQSFLDGAPTPAVQQPVTTSPYGPYRSPANLGRV